MIKARSFAALLAVCVFAVSSASGQGPTRQNWSPAQWTTWYTTSQGSRLIPYEWWRALEQADNQSAFTDAAYFNRFGYIPTGGDLPIGFVLDRDANYKLRATHFDWKPGQKLDEPWVGLTCSACHTGEITYQGKRMRIEGGPAMADFQSFINELTRALKATRDDPAKFDRFAAKVLGAQNNPANRTKLAAALKAYVATRERAEEMNATPLHYGPGRLDAFGYIFNRVALLASPGNAGNPSDAPVSYPFLWNIPQQTHIQWNGIAQNHKLGGPETLDIGALGRNVGEVTGVFADVAPIKNPSLAGYQSSVAVRNIVTLEGLLKDLDPPRWPEAMFGPIDAAKAPQGRALYAKYECSSCHTAPTNRTTPITLSFGRLYPNVPVGLANSDGRKIAEPVIGTDIKMACNAFAYQAKAGVMKGIQAEVMENGKRKKRSVKDPDYIHVMLPASVRQTLIGKKRDVAGAASDTFFTVNSSTPKSSSLLASLFGKKPTTVETAAMESEQEALCAGAGHPLLSYKAPPLAGVWATAPYLHNGSVPSLYELLKPPGERLMAFYTGSREYDPVNVGYIIDQRTDNPFRFNVIGPMGKIAGNSNGGHDFGPRAANASPEETARVEAERRALVEYLKTL